MNEAPLLSYILGATGGRFSMQILRIVCFIACLAITTSAQAQGFKATELISAFETMCLSTNADPTTVLARVAARGWMNESPQRYGNNTTHAFLGAEAGSHQALLLGEKAGEFSRIPIRTHSCAVMATVDDPKAVITYAEKVLTAVHPNQSDAMGKQWIYAQGAQGPREIVEQEDAVRVIRDGLYRELMVSDQQGDDSKGNVALQLTVSVSR